MLNATISCQLYCKLWFAPTWLCLNIRSLEHKQDLYFVCPKWGKIWCVYAVCSMRMAMLTCDAFLHLPPSCLLHTNSTFRYIVTVCISHLSNHNSADFNGCIIFLSYSLTTSFFLLVIQDLDKFPIENIKTIICHIHVLKQSFYLLFCNLYL